MTSTKTDATASAPPQAVFARLEVLKKRGDFVAASRAKWQAMPGLTLQIRDRGDDGPPRVGFTCSKKVGNAVARNRAKRRLREVARLELAPLARPGHDYVLIGKRDATAQRPFEELRADLRRAVQKLTSI